MRYLKNLLQEVEVKHLGKWLFLGGLVGVVAGGGAAFFFWLLTLSKDYFLAHLAGLKGPTPAGEGISFYTELVITRRWLLLFIPAIGGLISGLLIYTFAPEAEGHGTDAVIDAFHRKRGLIRPIVPIIKTIASAITIGSGGSAGREGPIAQIGAAFYPYEVIVRFSDFKSNEYANLIGGKLSVVVTEQCTGLKDKNGKLIFEGDVLRCKKEHLDEIVYRGVSGAFVLKCIGEDYANETLSNITSNIIDLSNEQEFKQGYKNEPRNSNK